MNQLVRSAKSRLGKIVHYVKKPQNRPKVFIIGFALFGIAALLAARAATPNAALELELGTLGGCTQKVNDTTASAGAAIQFCAATSGGGSTTAGAQIPLQYDISSLTGTVRYVDDNGNDSNAGSSSAPFATLAKAVSASAANDTIVVKGGLYRNQRNVSITKAGLRIIAAPNETPIFSGSVVQSSTSGWTTEGSYRYISYTGRPLKEGGGVSFNSESDMTNLLGDGSGRYPDQVWIGNTALDQVSAKSSLGDGKFYVDRQNKRLYMTATDSAKSGIETSRSNPTPENDATNNPDRDRLFSVNASSVKIEGLTITRYAANAYDYGVITVAENADNVLLKNLDISHLPFEGIHAGFDNALTVQNLTMNNVGWQSINTNQTDNFTLAASKITNTDPFDEFNQSPASGALKTSRNRNTTVKDSIISNNKSHGLWFDQSNINTTAANNTIVDNSAAGIFFEISDGLTLVNNYIKTSGGSQPFKAVGSGGLIIVNNTFVGGIDPVGVYTDPRSIPGCSTRTAAPYCQIESDVQKRFPRPATLDWMPRIDIMLNNIMAYPTNSQYCVVSPFCVNTYHPQPASAPIETIIHKANSTLGLQQTVIDGNVYVAGSSGVLIRRGNNENISYSSLSAWTAAMAASPVSIAGIDANSKSGSSWVNPDGSPTSALTAAHGQAVAVPTNSKINAFIPAGTKHYGVLNK